MPALLLALVVAWGAFGGDYLIVDVSGGTAAVRWPVRESDAPADLTDNKCRTGEIWFRKMSGGLAAGIFELTQAQYRLMTGENPSRHLGDMRPVESVTWIAAKALSEKVSQKTGLAFRLPTAAEWERACRAGGRTSFSNGVGARTHFDPRIDEICRYGYNRFDGRGGFSEHATVGSFKPNAWGLYDMHGNVAEWCSDTEGKFPPVHPLRGGMWYECMEIGSAFACTSDFKGMADFVYAVDDYASDLAGFRLFCEFQAP